MGPIEYSVFYLAQIIRNKHKDEKLADEVLSIASNCHDAILSEQVDGFDGSNFNHPQNKAIYKLQILGKRNIIINFNYDGRFKRKNKTIKV